MVATTAVMAGEVTDGNARAAAICYLIASGTRALPPFLHEFRVGVRREAKIGSAPDACWRAVTE
jgi:hypothetical protein